MLIILISIDEGSSLQRFLSEIEIFDLQLYNTILYYHCSGSRRISVSKKTATFQYRCCRAGDIAGIALTSESLMRGDSTLEEEMKLKLVRRRTVIGPLSAHFKATCLFHAASDVVILWRLLLSVTQR
jgi:hypothetical protein